MKKLIVVLLASYLLINLSACTKFKNRDRHVTGQIIDSATNEPIANTAFELLVVENPKPVNGVFKEVPYSFSTDEKGIFDAVYRSKRNQHIAIVYPGGSWVDLNRYVIWDKDSGEGELLDAGIIKGYRR